MEDGLICPRCGAELDEIDVEEGTCPNCNADIDGDGNADSA